MKNERISVRVDDEFKKKLEISANKEHKTLSKFISTTLREKVENDGLNDSQGQFLKLFDLAFIQSFEPFFNRLLVILNKNNFNTEWLLRENDLFYKHLKIPQNKDDLQTSFVMHPISEVTKEKLLKDIRTQSARKKSKENEYE